MDKKTDDFLTQYRFALIGFSRNGKKFGNYIYRRLSSKGLHIYPVNPAGGVDGKTLIHRSLKELPVKPQAVIIAVKASSVEQAIRDVIEAGIKRIWIIGSGHNVEIQKLCDDNGIEIIHNRCILMYFGGFPHNVHYFFHRLIRKVSKTKTRCVFYDTLGEWADFTALHDGSKQKFWLGLPDTFESRKPSLMGLYLHQQDSDWSGVLTSGMFDYCRSNGMIAVSTDYRGPVSHLNPAALDDIKQILYMLKEKFNIPAWFACGVSMGAIAAIQLCFLLPEELRPSGVVAVLPAFSIREFYNNADKETQRVISNSFGGTPEAIPYEYDKRSPDSNIKRIASTTPFAIFAGKHDVVFAPEKHARPLNEALRANGNPLLYKELDINHDPEVFTACYKEGLEFLEEKIKAAL